MADPTPAKDRFSSSQKERQATWGAFALSVGLHAGALLLVGSYVIYQGILPKEPFIPVEGSVDLQNEDMVMPEPQEVPESPELTVLTDQPTTEKAAEGEATPVDILVSSGSNPSFTLPPAVGVPAAIPRLGSGTGGAVGDTGRVSTAPKGTPVRSIFGNSNQIPAALTGTLYDLKQPKGGGAAADQPAFLRRYSAAGFDPNLLRDFYAAETKLYATQIFMPMISAEVAPRAFQVENEVKPKNWLARYVGKFAAPKKGNYRFVGQGDDVLVVRVNEKVVFDGSIDLALGGPSNVGWSPTPEQIRKNQGPVSFIPLVFGDWMALEKGVNNTIEVLVGEIPGGNFCAYLFIEQEGEKYGNDWKRYGAPVLPIFRTLSSKDDWTDVADQYLPAYVKDGPIFTPKSPKP